MSFACLHSRHICNRERVPGFEYCITHILDDKNAPYKQCNFMLKGQKRCHRAAPKADKKDGYCAEHTRKALIARQKVGRKRTSDLTQRCIEDLGHYKKERIEAPVVPKTEPGVQASTSTNADDKTAVKVEQLVRKDVFELLTGSIPTISQRVIDSSEVDSDDDGLVVENTWRGDGDSDAESVDSDIEDPLKHAGAYSAEEVIRIMRDKLIRLQKLYIDQFQRLHYLLREERRRYRVGLRKEKEDLLVSIHTQPKDTPEEQLAFEKIRSLMHYNKPQGQEAILHSQLMEKRIRASEGANYKPSPSISSTVIATKCSYNLTTSTKCGDICIPMSKFCIKHILEDPNQVLFRACDFSTAADGPCETPIPDVFGGSTCLYHTQIPPSIFEEKEAGRLSSFERTQKEETEDEPPQLSVVPGAAN